MLKKSPVILLCLYVLLCRAGTLQAAAAQQWQTGIAMHGAPALPGDFAHLPYVNPDAPKGGILRMSVQGGFDSLNSSIIKGRAAPGLYLTNDSLMARSWGEPFTLYGLIAEKVAVTPNRKRITFALNPKARFHDGTQITADDVLWTFNTLKEKGKPNARATYGKIANVRILSPRLIEFTMGAEADAETPLIVAMMPVYSRRFWQNRDFTEPSLQFPIGNGPYRITAVDGTNRIEYTRVQDYWAKDLPINRGLYNFDKIIYDVFRDDSVAMESFRVGTTTMRRESNPLNWAKSYQTMPAIRQIEIAHGRPEPLRGFVLNLRRPVFADLPVRRAFALAFDFDWINRSQFNGVFKRTSSVFSNSELAARGIPSVKELALLDPWRKHLPENIFAEVWHPPHTDGSGPQGARGNLREADRILSESGYPVTKGVRMTPDGYPLTIEILLNDPADQKIALEYSRSLKRLGIIANVRLVDSAQYAVRMENYEYDITIGRWISTLSPGAEQLAYWGSVSGKTPGGRNLAGLDNPAIDALAAAIARADSRENLVTAARALDRAVMAQNAIIPFGYVGKDWIAVQNSIQLPKATALYGVVQESWWQNVSSSRNK